MHEIINKAALLVLLNGQMSHPLFNEDMTSIMTAELPFYTDYLLVKAKSYSTIPSVEFGFLWNRDSDDVIKLDGSRECLFDNIDRLKPLITTQTALAYVKFVLGSVWDENGAIKVCETIDDVIFSANPSPNELTFLGENIKSATITESSDMIVVECNIVYGTALHYAKIELQRDGLFEIVDEKQIGDEIDALRTIFLE